MTRRLVLLASLPEVGQRDLVLPGGRDLELASSEPAAELAFGPVGSVACSCGDDHAARSTAAKLELNAEPLALLAARNLGSWKGRSLVELADEDHLSIERFQRDVAFAPPGGEALLDVVGRVAGWMDIAATSAKGRALIVVDPDVVRAAIAVALDAPTAMLRVDVVALSRTVLTHFGSGWRVTPHPTRFAGRARPRHRPCRLTRP